MNISTTRLLILLMAITLLLGGCREREEVISEDGVSGTIAPAEPQPAPTGTEAMTQTVDIEGGRSEAEGGILTNTDVPPPAVSGTDTTATGGSPPPPTGTR